MYSDGVKSGSTEGEGVIPPSSPWLLQALSQKIFFPIQFIKNFFNYFFMESFYGLFKINPSAFHSDLC